MPAYNAEQYIQQSIESVINQTYQNWELLIINDGSADGTKQIADSYSAIDNRIFVINQENKRLGAARNAGIKAAKGEWLAFLDSDDLWHPDKLEKQIAYYEQNTNIDIIYTAGWTFNNNDLTVLKPYIIQIGICNAKQMYNLQYEGNCIPVLSVIIKKNVVTKTGFQGEDLSIAGCEDWDYWMRAAKAGATFYGMEDKLFYYRRHDSNMSSDITKMGIAELSVLLKNFDPKLISTNHFISTFKKRLKHIVIMIFNEGKAAQLKPLLLNINKISSSIYLGLLYKFLSFKKTPYLSIKLLNKLDSLFSRN